MDVQAMQRKLMLMLTIVGVCTLACAGALFGGIHYHQPLLTAAGVTALLVGFGVQIWFIRSVSRRPRP
jgi:hypothetical protein